jgi:PAS domain S-box-containing protein
MIENIQDLWNRMTSRHAPDEARRQAALFLLSAELAASLEEDEVYRRVVDGLHATLGYDFVAIFMMDEATGKRFMKASIGFDDPPRILSPGEGISERPFLDGQIHYIPDVNQDPRYFYGMGGSEVDVPIHTGGQVSGVLIAESKQRDAFNQDDFEVLTAAAQQAGLAIEKVQLLSAERQRADELDALRKTITDLTAELGLSTLLHDIVERAAGLLNASGGELGLFDQAKQEIEIVVSYNIGDDYVGTRHALGEGAMGKAAQTGEALIIQDYHAWEGALPEYPQIHSTLVAPLKVGGRLVGVFTTVTTDYHRQFTQADLHLLDLFGQQAAIAIENARLYEQAQQEITERVKVEDGIRQQKEYFESLFINNPVAVVTADLDGVIVSWNPMAKGLFGYTQDEVIGKNLDDIVANDESIRTEAIGYTNQVIQAGRVQTTTRRTRKDGTMVDVELLALPVIVAEQKIGFISIYHDITALQEARRQAEAANKAKSAFLANMSHELRTPMNAILGFTQLMSNDPNLNDSQRENLDIINRSGEHLLYLINNVLEMSKIEAGRVILQERSFDLHLMLANLVEVFRLRSEEKGLSLDFTLGENVPLYVTTDEGRLRQVLMNLLGNALKFTQAGGATLHVNASEPGKAHDEDKAGLYFEVHDTGPGIEAEELAKIFDPFVQSASGQEYHEGTGLGLSISRQFVRLMGGDLTVSSVIGQGSIFKFEVLVRLADKNVVQVAYPKHRPLGLAPGGPNYRILVVEDRDTNRLLMVKLLESLGFEVKEAVNGLEAIELSESWQPHLIWMDMRMPVMDGREATKRIKSTPKGSAIPIIALTASAFEEDREQIMAAGCDDFVRKPFKQADIVNLLIKYLQVSFVYEDKQAIPSAVDTPEMELSYSDALTPEALQALPASWLADLKKETVKADLFNILALINQIRQQDPVVAEALFELANNFEHNKILRYLEEAGV